MPIEIEAAAEDVVTEMSSDGTGIGPAPWALTEVVWSASLMDLELSDTCAGLPDAGSWSASPSDYMKVENEFALEIRAEAIHQFVAGDSLRCGDVEQFAVGRSDVNADFVRHRDRVQVDGNLREHTGRELIVEASQVELVVDGNLDVHAGQDVIIRLLGPMKDVWNGGCTVIAANASDWSYGGGVLVSAPLCVNLGGIVTRKYVPACATVDLSLTEVFGTLFERETKSGEHHSKIAVFNGSLYVTARPGFLPLMRIACGVRNLTAPAGEGGDGGSNSSFTPPPAEGESDATSVKLSGSTIAAGSTY